MREYTFGVFNKFPLQVVVDGHSCHLNLIIPALINKKKKKKEPVILFLLSQLTTLLDKNEMAFEHRLVYSLNQ